jgi:hypothetical protein
MTETNSMNGDHEEYPLDDISLSDDDETAAAKAAGHDRDADINQLCSVFGTEYGQ